MGKTFLIQFYTAEISTFGRKPQNINLFKELKLILGF